MGQKEARLAGGSEGGDIDEISLYIGDRVSFSALVGQGKKRGREEERRKREEKELP